VRGALGIACLLVLCVAARAARADEALTPIAHQRWYEGPHGTNRLLHFSLTTVGFVLYPTLSFVENDIACNWCGGPNDVDRSIRNALVWSDTNSAALTSDITAYALSPAVDITLVLAGTVAAPSTAAVMDDIVPIAESMVVTEWITRAIKINAARERPYAHFTDERGKDDNLSFPSGHTSRAFAFATSAGVIAHARGYKSEPYIWAAGMTLGVVTAYLRIAADKHYFTDVLAGSAIGVSAGLTVPLLMRRTNVEVVATRRGIALAGAW
jgi:membrane-associated phospholipid phosphatase